MAGWRTEAEALLLVTEALDGLPASDPEGCWPLMGRGIAGWEWQRVGQAEVESWQEQRVVGTPQHRPAFATQPATWTILQTHKTYYPMKGLVHKSYLLKGVHTPGTKDFFCDFCYG
jgi:hypothetical protein